MDKRNIVGQHDQSQQNGQESLKDRQDQARDSHQKEEYPDGDPEDFPDEAFGCHMSPFCRPARPATS